MARHLAAFYQSVDISTFTAINAVPDQQVFTNGTGLRVPPEVANIDMVSAVSFATTLAEAQIVTPTLRQTAPYDITGKNLAVATIIPLNKVDLFDAPLSLKGNDTLTFSLGGTSTGSQDNYGLVELCDGPVKKVTGNIFTVRATGTATLAAGVFTLTALAFDTELNPGSYNVVGFRAEGPNLIAARMVFPSQVWRPGVLGASVSTVNDDMRNRAGNSGSFGTFDINQPPNVECLGITDTTQVFYLDLMQMK